MTVFSPQAVADWFGCGNATDLATTLKNAHGPHGGTGGTSSGGVSATIAFYGDGGSNEWLEHYSNRASGTNVEPFVSPIDGVIDFLSFTHNHPTNDHGYNFELFINGAQVYTWGNGTNLVQTAWIRPAVSIPVAVGDRISAYWPRITIPNGGPSRFFVHCHMSGDLPSVGDTGSTVYP